MRFLFTFTALFLIHVAGLAQTYPPYNLSVVLANNSESLLIWNAPYIGLYEDFEDNIAQGFEWWHPEGYHSIEYGYAEMYSDYHLGNWGSGVNNTLVFTDFSLEAEIINVDSLFDGGSRGLLFRGDGPKDSNYDGYAFLLAFTAAVPSHYLIGRWDNGNTHTLIYWTQSDAINTGDGATNTIKVIGQGSEFYFYINGVYVESITDNTYSSGVVGFTQAEWVLAHYEYISCSHEAELMDRSVEPVHGETVTEWFDVAGRPSGQPPVMVERNQGKREILHCVQDDEQGATHDERHVQSLDDLDEFIDYIVYRDSVEIGRTDSTTYTDPLPGFGTYTYTVTAYYDEGESDPTNPATVQYDPVTLNVTPSIDTVPAEGGGIVYDAHLLSNLPSAYANVRYSTFVQAPNGTTYGPLLQLPFTLTPFMEISRTDLTQTIPSGAPGGTYTFIGRVGYNTQYVEDVFTFTKEGTSLAGDPDWWNSPGFNVSTGVAADLVTAIPSDDSLSAAHPNPFNTATTISVNLPETADLRVAVYNVTGKRVAELAQGSFAAGTHSFTFDASGLASGLYFVRATVPGHMDQVRKVMLLR